MAKVPQRRSRAIATTSKDQMVLPPGISFEKCDLPQGGWAFVFRSREFGELGRLLVQEVEGDLTHLSLEVVGDPADPATARRQELFEPLGRELMERMGRAAGPGPSPSRVAVPPPQPSTQKAVIASKLVACVRCGTPVAMLIFADQAANSGQLEDYARLMYAQYVQRNLPTWLIGPPSDLRSFEDSFSDVLQVWPRRSTTVQRLRSAQFSQLLEPLVTSHCP